MSMERISGQGYAPIPQSISNSDTDDEDGHPESGNVVNCQTCNKIHVNSEGRQNGWHSRSDGAGNSGDDTGDNREGYRYRGDDVPIIAPEVTVQDDFWKGRDASLLRRCCLVFSIFFCFATVLVFLYVLPCDSTAICPSTEDRRSDVAWHKTLEGIELQGRISVVNGSPYSLIFLLRGQRFGADSSSPPESRRIATDGGGVLSIQGNSGTTLWWIPLTKPPADIDCARFDSDGSGTPDCVVTTERLLLSIDPVAGITHWNTPVRTDSQLPLQTPDVDRDGINDTLIAVRFGFPHGGLVILSGKTGKPLTRYFDDNCLPYYPIRLNGFTSTDNISYSCQTERSNGKTINVNLTVSLRKFVETNELEFSKPNGDIEADVNRTKLNEPLEIMEKFENSTIQLTPYYKLKVDNSVPCPGPNCRVKVTVILQSSDGNDRVIWDYRSNDSYAMRPAIYPMGDDPYITGFAIKFWQWDDTEEIIVGQPDNIIKRRLSERIVIVFVNYTDVHVPNPSQEEIIQLCRGNDCQPSLQLQTRSIAIADLGNDGTWQLINYKCSYSIESELVLTTKLQVVKLDTAIEQLTRTGID